MMKTPVCVDEEWTSLLKEAKDLGLSVEDIRHFLSSRRTET